MTNEVFQAYSTFSDYLSYPVNVAVSLETNSDALDFPAVTVCNNNILRRSSVKRIAYLNDLSILDTYIMQKVEIDTGINDECGSYMFQCNNGICINWSWVCNNRTECRDGEDEEPFYNCTQLQKNPNNDVCNPGYIKCPGETTCAQVCNNLNECVLDFGFDESPQVGCYSTCFDTVSATHEVQTITSPNFPNEYDLHLNCEYRILAPQGFVLQLNFTHFDVEVSETCEYDFVRIRNGHNPGDNFLRTEKGKRFLCGSELYNFTTSGNSAVVYFFSDNFGTFSGWSLDYYLINNTKSKRTKRSDDKVNNLISKNNQNVLPIDSNESSEPKLSTDHQNVENYDFNQVQKNNAEIFTKFSESLKSFDELKKYDWFTLYQTSTESEFRSFLKFRADEIIGNGHQKDNFIVNCVFNGKDCKDKFKTVQIPDYGNCFTFNSFLTESKPLNTSKPGSEHGLKLSLFLERDEYFSIIRESAGATVVVHDFKQKPSLKSNSILISPGKATIIALRQKQIIRKPHPFSTCVTDWPEFLELSPKYLKYEYSFDFCEELCRELTLARECGCIDSFNWDFSQNEEIRKRASKFCDVWNSTESECVNEVYESFESDQRNCHCNLQCEDRQFSTRVSASEWPTMFYLYYMTSLLQESGSPEIQKFINKVIRSREYTTEHLMSSIRKDFARVELYFESLSFQKNEELPKYRLSALFGTLGGNLGLWLGWSVLTLFEVSHWVYACIKVLLLAN
ncbi:epithelial sodium channel subunit beta-2-like isoform X2 [Convolutriloba macropyga]|uniref:epithelial sodium channel subunit beta-2-like isoform X2 n=1 Tax=Convolutriloba macropyga TaxID=536237 RepID=UPI003F522D89